jgi:chemotaxis protein methyltransferase CheR
LPPRGSLGLEDIEVGLLLEGIFKRYGFDFREYARAPLRQRILSRVQAEKARTVSGLQEALLRDARAFERFVTTVSAGGRGLFSQPQSDRVLRTVVAPALRKRRRPRLWHVGCATGEELYSTAVVLREEELTERSRVYATDLHEGPLRQAAAGSLPLARLRAAESGYRAAGGRARLQDYYEVAGGRGVFRSDLRKNVLFATHNYMTDSSFNEFDAVVCRSLLSELGHGLQQRVHRLIYDSLATGGYLLVRPGTDLDLLPPSARYEAVDASGGLFRKTR